MQTPFKFGPFGNVGGLPCRPEASANIKADGYIREKIPTCTRPLLVFRFSFSTYPMRLILRS